MAKAASKLSDDEILRISRRYFYIGFAFLPFLWLINVLYFRSEVKNRADRIDKKVHSCKHIGIHNIIITIAIKDIKYSLIGTILWLVISSAWFGVFVANRVQWGLAADKLTVVIPKGY